jgi:hypothetical protein
VKVALDDEPTFATAAKLSPVPLKLAPVIVTVIDDALIALEELETLINMSLLVICEVTPAVSTVLLTPCVNPPNIVTRVAASTTVIAINKIVAMIGDTALSSLDLISFILIYLN